MRISAIIGFILVISSIIIIQPGCKEKNTGRPLHDPSLYKEPLIQANKEAIKEENLQIEDYIRRHNWKMETTRTGLRIMITKKGIGIKAQKGRTVKLSYTMTSITGDTLYTALKEGPLVFEVGKGQVISGLEEAILFLSVGDRAKIIIPSHLAYGLIGDQKKISYKASLVYDIEFISMF
jgi:FKBP-type peptidyl-prolyl cis-trans isomerase